MASTPARTKKKAEPEYEDIELVGSFDSEAEAFNAKIFGEEVFRFSTDVNGFLLMNAVRGGGEFIDLLDSMVLLPEGSQDLYDREMERLRSEEKERFHGVLSDQKHLSVERLARLVGDITEIAGNVSGETSSTD
jgi:hypothetical protein